LSLSTILKAPPTLAVRLALSSGVCLFVFAARTVGFAKKIVAPSQITSWWWQYGVLELFPSVLFLIIMHPSTQHQRKKSTMVDVEGGVGGRVSTATTRNYNNRSWGYGSSNNRPVQRTDSYGSGSKPSSSTNRAQTTAPMPSSSETTPLVRPTSSSAAYGSSSSGGGTGIGVLQEKGTPGKV
jgi:hypothetical protein